MVSGSERKGYLFCKLAEMNLRHRRKEHSRLCGCVESDKRNVGLRNVGLRAQFAYITIYVNKRGNKKLYKLYTNPTQTLHFSDYKHAALCIVCVSNYTQTIHKPYIEAFKTLQERWE